MLDAGPGIPQLPLGPTTLQRLACQALVEPATHPDPGQAHAAENGQRARTEHRFATARQRRALLRRDGGCAFPGCPRRRGPHAYHRVHWSHGGPTTLENLVLTCAHHHQLLHEGGWRLQPHRDATGQRRWAAVHANGRMIPTAPATAGDADDLPDTHEADIAPTTVTGSWTGEPLHLDYAVSVLSQQRPTQAFGNSAEVAGTPAYEGS